ncbi:MAG TPA: hypothetical protein VKA98_01450, partial [Nitrososphaeraceae archaeon]|nr:hypothetical protein [Nitrososphaeraceae archaeon]
MFGNKNKIITKTKKSHGSPKLILHCNSLDEGTTAFMQWLSSEDKLSTNNPIILKEFVNNKYAIL